MKTLIILLNFLLISLILWSFLNSKVVEYFSGCPASQNNKVTQQSSQLSRNESQLAKLQSQYGELSSLAIAQNMRIKANGQNAKSITNDIMKEKGKKMKELNDLDKGFNGGGGGADIKKGTDSLNKLAKIMAESPSLSI